MKIKLKEMREKRNMTQRQLSIRSGIARGYINELEKGKYKNPSLKTLCKLAKALRCKISDLIDCEGENEK